MEEAGFEGKAESSGIAAWEVWEMAYGDEEGGGLFGFEVVAALEVIDSGELGIGELYGVEVDAVGGEGAGGLDESVRDEVFGIDLNGGFFVDFGTGDGEGVFIGVEGGAAGELEDCVGFVANGAAKLGDEQGVFFVGIGVVCPCDNGAHVKASGDELIVFEALFAFDPDFDFDDRREELSVDEE